MRITFFRQADYDTIEEIAGKIKDMMDSPPTEWDEINSTGLVVPLHKKGPINNLNNYRGVCLLPMVSRVIARILATRLRTWAEEVELLDDNQTGFRSGRSTADAAQMFIRLNEEWERMYENKERTTGQQQESENDPVATLLDITKAYPRLNKPFLWHLLERKKIPTKILRLLQGLHEFTSYEVRGSEGNSTKWTPERGVREGCSTSPILFNIYHAEAMRRAAEKRRETATELGMKVGLEWMWIPGNSFPPRNVNKPNSNARKFTIEDSLFADDTTLVGNRREMAFGKEVIKREMRKYEEICHDGKEEHLNFGRQSGADIRMLGSFIGRKTDVEQRLIRGRKAWFMLRKRLKGSKMSKVTQGRVTAAIVESTMLFACEIRPWRKSEVKRMQQFVDKAYI